MALDMLPPRPQETGLRCGREKPTVTADLSSGSQEVFFPDLAHRYLSLMSQQKLPKPRALAAQEAGPVTTADTDWTQHSTGNTGRRRAGKDVKQNRPNLTLSQVSQSLLPSPLLNVVSTPSHFKKTTGFIQKPTLSLLSLNKALQEEIRSVLKLVPLSSRTKHPRAS